MRTRRYALVIAAVVTAVVVAAALVAATNVAARGNVGAPVKAGGTGHTITVNGHGEADVAPDTATLSLGVESRGMDAQSALASASSRTNAVVAAVKAQGIPASHIQTSNLSIWYDSQSNAYVATHELTVKITDVNSVGSVLDAAVAAGANNSWGVQFGLSNPSNARSQALQAAVGDARKRAESLAAALGVTISGIGSVSEASYSNPINYAAPTPAGQAGSGTNVQPGQLQITGDITTVYTFG